MTSTKSYSKGKYTHLILKGKMNDPLFRYPSDYDKFLDLLQIKQNQYMFKLICYNIFENYVHLIVEESIRGTISSIVHGLSLLYTKYYQLKYDYKGSIFATGYQKEIITSNKELICRTRFIHQKSLHRKESKGLSYKFSSFISYCSPSEVSILNRSIIYRLFDKQDDVKASNLYKVIHYDIEQHNWIDVDINIYEKIAIAKRILKEELSVYHVNYDCIPKNIPFRENLILKIYNESKLSQQEIADLLSLSRHIVGRVIRLNNPN